jgi:NAD-dependent SIR2 family protein deacetylase
MISLKNTFDKKLDRFARVLGRSEYVVIGAGSGLSVDAGLDYFSKEAFAKTYPAMLQYGHTMSAQLMGFGNLSPALFWGYYLAHGYNMRFGPSRQDVYERLLDFVSVKEYFVITTNVDAFFERNGFAKERIYTPQGDYGRMQCLKPCSTQTWKSKPIIDELMPYVDPATQKLPEDLVPICPNCGGPVFYNIRGGHWFVDSPYRDQARQYQYWLKENRNRNTLFMDIGTGFNTPGWIRWPFEKMTYENQLAHLVRINLDEPEVPDGIKQRSISFSDRAKNVIKALWEKRVGMVVNPNPG